jgi:hypothetical protein
VSCRASAAYRLKSRKRRRRALVLILNAVCSNQGVTQYKQDLEWSWNGDALTATSPYRVDRMTDTKNEFLLRHSKQVLEYTRGSGSELFTVLTVTVKIGNLGKNSRRQR